MTLETIGTLIGINDVSAVVFFISTLVLIYMIARLIGMKRNNQCMANFRSWRDEKELILRKRHAYKRELNMYMHDNERTGELRLLIDNCDEKLAKLKQSRPRLLAWS